MSNVDINVDRRTDGRTDGQTDGRTEKRTPISQSEEVRELFHARFDGCPVLKLIRILTSTLLSNVDINVDRRTDRLTDGRKSGRLYRTLLQAGSTKAVYAD